ncbi:MAG: RnfABCDGE type electron transport complex subunit B [Pseudomonadota bacterium]
MAGAELFVLAGLAGGLAVLLALARRRYAPDDDAVAAAVDAVLPQTQCAQCGYPGCRPYAEAVVAGAPLDLCPPGGVETQQKLAQLLSRDPGPALPKAEPVLARIDENRCIGCFLCVEACPVDAIVGAPKFLHTVLEDRCTGCELCLPPCPVDCIDLIPLDASTSALLPVVQLATDGETAGCIRCGRCEPVCPEALPVERLWWVSREGDLEEAVAAGLDDCIECGLCNPACPSGLDLVGTFKEARSERAREQAAAAAAERARLYYDERINRLARAEEAAKARRAARLAGLKR